MRPIVHLTKNRFEVDAGPTTGGVEALIPIVECVEAPANRLEDCPVGSVIRKLTLQVNPTTSVAGKHQMMLVYRPAAENVATPIASYFDGTDPLTEEGVKLRRLSMSRVQTKHITAGAQDQRPFYFKWKGAKRLYDGDSIDLAILDDAATSYDIQHWFTFSQ